VVKAPQLVTVSTPPVTVLTPISRTLLTRARIEKVPESAIKLSPRLQNCHAQFSIHNRALPLHAILLNKRLDRGLITRPRNIEFS
jgi:hypothetical protein